MKKTTTLVALFVSAAVLLILQQTPSAAAAGTTLAADSFTRTLTDSWGAASTGGSYTLSGTTGAFDVNGSAGTMALTAPNVTLSAYLTGVQVKDLDATFRVKKDKLAVGGGQIAYLIARRVSEGNEYAARLRFGTDGKVYVQAAETTAGTSKLLGTETATALTQTANAWIRVRTQVTGVNPTTIKMRVWADGAIEPTTWNYTATGSAATLQVAGAVGFRTYLSSAATNAPVLFSFDDLNVVDASPTTTPTVYWGANIDGKEYGVGSPPWDWNAVTNFESHAGKKISILHWGQPWKSGGVYVPFKTSAFETTRQHGVISLIDFGSWDGGAVNQPQFKLSAIYNGQHDAFLRQWATDAKAWGHPFFLRFDWEMNGWWFPWGEGKTSTGALPNGNQPGDYVKAYRHVHDIFASVGATNVTWVWCPNRVLNYPNDIARHAPLSQVYPGDSYVDWTCLDGYNWGTDNGGTWQTFSQIFTKSYNDVLALAPSKPMMIGEIASSEDGGPLGRPYSKGPWNKDTFTTQLPLYFPKIKAVVWYNRRDGTTTLDWPIESSSNSQSAFAAAIASGYYATNTFGNLSASKILPLK